MPLYLNEVASEAAQIALSQDFGQLVTSTLTLVELRSGLARYERDGVLNAEQAARIFERARYDLARAPRRLELSQEVINEAIRLLSSYHEPIRTLDALHVASCLRYGTQGFVTNDKQQAQFARTVGIHAHWLGGGLER